MNKEETIAAIAVMQAYVDGKATECKASSTPEYWKPVINPSFLFDYTEYRVKPVVVKYRRALMKNGPSGHSIAVMSDNVFPDRPTDFERNCYFIRWIDKEWQEEVV